NTAGQGNTVGGRWEEFEYIFERYGKKIGLCLDTAHSFQAGYDIREKDILYEMIDIIKKVSYPGSIFIIHSNDSPSPRGSHLDRHQHIGKGYLGEETFELLIRDEYLGTLPFIIETPKEDIEMDRRNLDILREIGKRYKRI
ncbi:MAG TPA: TIM barrel protein, partial [bacterium]|nr:TIM barrel protein [bacterium]